MLVVSHRNCIRFGFQGPQEVDSHKHQFSVGLLRSQAVFHFRPSYLAAFHSQAACIEGYTQSEGPESKDSAQNLSSNHSGHEPNFFSSHAQLHPREDSGVVNR